MQCVCGYCGVVYGEKCSRCGDADPMSVGRNGGLRDFKCSNVDCNHHWIEAADPVITGICSDCQEKHLPGLRGSLSI